MKSLYKILRPINITSHKETNLKIWKSNAHYRAKLPFWKIYQDILPIKERLNQSSYDLAPYVPSAEKLKITTSHSCIPLHHSSMVPHSLGKHRAIFIKRKCIGCIKEYTNIKQNIGSILMDGYYSICNGIDDRRDAQSCSFTSAFGYKKLAVKCINQIVTQSKPTNAIHYPRVSFTL